MTELEKAGLIPTLEAILYECREIVTPDKMGMGEADTEKEHSAPHLAWLEKVKTAIADIGMPLDEPEEGKEEGADMEEECEEDSYNPAVMIHKAIYGGK